MLNKEVRQILQITDLIKQTKIQRDMEKKLLCFAERS